MMLTDIVMYFGLEKAEEVCGFSMGSGWPIKKARPVTQMRVFIASNGAVEMDDALIDLILQVAKVENKKRLSRNTYDPKGKNDE